MQTIISLSRARQGLLPVFYGICVQLGVLAQQDEASTRVPVLSTERWPVRNFRRGQMASFMRSSVRWASDSLFATPLNKLCVLTSRCCSILRSRGGQGLLQGLASPSRQFPETQAVLRRPSDSSCSVLPGTQGARASGASQSATVGSPSAAEVTASRDYCWRVLTAFLVLVALTCLFVCLTWIVISHPGSGSDPLLKSSEEGQVDPFAGVDGAFGMGDVSERKSLMWRLSCAIFISLFGFWAGVGAGASSPIRSALLAAM